jgi:hypothetical protein
MMTVLEPKQEELCEQSRWDFSDLGAIFINCTLKRSPEQSHTQGLADISMEILRRLGVRERLHQPQLDLHDLEPAVPRGDDEGRGRHARARHPALRMGRRLSLRLPEPRAPLTGRKSWPSHGHVRAADLYRVTAGKITEKLSYVKG